MSSTFTDSALKMHNLIADGNERRRIQQDYEDNKVLRQKTIANNERHQDLRGQQFDNLEAQDAAMKQLHEKLGEVERIQSHHYLTDAIVGNNTASIMKIPTIKKALENKLGPNIPVRNIDVAQGDDKLLAREWSEVMPNSKYGFNELPENVKKIFSNSFGVMYAEGRWQLLDKKEIFGLTNGVKIPELKAWMDEYTDTMDEFNRSQQNAAETQGKVLQTDEGLKSTHPDGSKLQTAPAADPNQAALDAANLRAKELENSFNEATMIPRITKQFVELGMTETEARQKALDLFKDTETADADIQNKIDGAGKTAAERRIAEAKSHPTWLTAELDSILTTTAGNKTKNRGEEVKHYPDIITRDNNEALATLSDRIFDKEGYRIPKTLNDVPKIATILHRPGALQADMSQILTDLANRRDVLARNRSTQDEKHRLRVFSGLIDGFERFKALKNATDFSAAAAGFVDGPINDMAKYIDLGEQSQIDWQQTLERFGLELSSQYGDRILKNVSDTVNRTHDLTAHNRNEATKLISLLSIINATGLKLRQEIETTYRKNPERALLLSKDLVKVQDTMKDVAKYYTGEVGKAADMLQFEALNDDFVDFRLDISANLEPAVKPIKLPGTTKKPDNRTLREKRGG